MNSDFDFVSKPSHRLVYPVVDDFIDKVMETARAGGTDIHTGTLANGLKPFEYLYVLFAVGIFLSQVELLTTCEKRDKRKRGSPLASRFNLLRFSV
jgi:hypothetical protein